MGFEGLLAQKFGGIRGLVAFEDFLAREFEGHVTKFAPHKALKLIAWGKMTFDERVVLHRVVPGPVAM